MMDKVKQLTQNSENFIRYQEWCELPMTKFVLEAMSELIIAENAQPIKMVGTQGVTIEINAIENARKSGMCEGLMRLVNFTNEKARVEMPPEDYGSQMSVQSGGAGK